MVRTALPASGFGSWTGVVPIRHSWNLYLKQGTYI